MDNVTISLVAAITAAVVLQALILVALYLAVRKTSARVEALAGNELQDKADAALARHGDIAAGVHLRHEQERPPDQRVRRLPLQRGRMRP